MIRAGLIAAVCASLALPAAASAATIVSGPQASTINYLNPDVVIAPGETLELANYDMVGHDITSADMFQPEGRKCPKGRKGRKCRKRHPKPPPELLFRSDLIGFGETSTVTGTERLEPGRTYSYFCSLHLSMTGTVSVAN